VRFPLVRAAFVAALFARLVLFRAAAAGLFGLRLVLALLGVFAGSLLAMGHKSPPPTA
jgi:hypothetical protein